MKKILIILLLACSLQSFAEHHDVNFFSINIGYGWNNPMLVMPKNRVPDVTYCDGMIYPIQTSNGVSVGIMNSTCNILWGFNFFADCDGKKPSKQITINEDGIPNFEPDILLCDFSGTAKIGYIFNRIGFGICAGGYHMLYNCNPYYDYKYKYTNYMGNIYNKASNQEYITRTIFNGGAFVVLNICPKNNIAGLFIMVESNHVQLINATIGFSINNIW